MSRYPRVEYKFMNYRLPKRTVECIDEISRIMNTDASHSIERAIDDLLKKLFDEEVAKQDKGKPKQLTFIAP
jgi:hypothetical protein